LAIATQAIVMAGFSLGWVCAGFRVIRNRVIRNVLINTLLG